MMFSFIASVDNDTFILHYLYWILNSAEYSLDPFFGRKPLVKKWRHH